MTFAMAAIARGEKAALFIFDEELGLAVRSHEGDGHRSSGRARQGQYPASNRSMPPSCRRASLRTGSADRSITQKIKTVVIDSLNGYQASMPEENSLILHMHELLQYLNRQGAATFMTVAQHGLVGDMQAPVDVTYLADTRHPAAIFRSDGQSSPRDLDHQEAHRLPRNDDPRIPDFRYRPLDGRTARRLPRRAARRAQLTPASKATSDRRKSPVTASGNLSERALVLAPTGRDAEIAAQILHEAGFSAEPTARSGRVV